MTTVPVVGVGSVRAIDLDLDVIRFHDGSVVIDDEEEFTEHRKLYGYPADVVELAERTCRDVAAGLTARTAPWDDETQRWLAEIR